MPSVLCAGWLVGTAAANDQSPPPLRLPGPETAVERCWAIEEDAARSRCYEEAGSHAIERPPDGPGAAAGAWRLIRTPNPGGGRDVASIMHTADFSRSDLGFAGLMFRCDETTIEMLAVLVRPLSPRAHPKVNIQASGKNAEFIVNVVPPGLLLLFPSEAIALVTGAWLAASELTIIVNGGEGAIHGVVPLTGVAAALPLLRSNCSTR